MPRIDLDKYVTVDVRIQKFWDKYPDGAILTELLYVDERTVRVKAAVYSHRTDVPGQPIGVGHAEEMRITEQQIKNNSRLRDLPNATSAVENCETSAVGRALAMAGLEVTRGVASRAEMEKVDRHQAVREETSEKALDNGAKAAKVEAVEEPKLNQDEARTLAGQIKATGMEMSAVKLKLTAMGIETPKTLAGALQDMTKDQAQELYSWVVTSTEND
jgi:hypothetical protein